MGNSKTAIVILNWNGEGMLEKYLPTLIRCSISPYVEIVVADNASTDGSDKLMREKFPQIPYIKLDRNYGFADGYNRALQYVRADYYMLLNSDVEVTMGWLEPMISYLDNNPQVAACQPKIHQIVNRDMFEYAGAAGGFIDRLGYPFCRGRIFDSIETDSGQYDTDASLFWATGAAMLVRSKVFKETGGFDADFFAHMEEIDLCWRMRARGYQIRLVPQSVVYHIGGGTLGAEKPYKTYLNFRNNALLLYKNLPEKELKPIMRKRYCLDIIAAVVYLLKFKPQHFAAVLKARHQVRSLKNKFKQKRQENMELAVTGNIPERTDFSILWRLHVKRQNTFNKLRIKTTE